MLCCTDGTVGLQEVVEAIYQQTGRDISDLEVTIPDIKALGTFECSVQLHPEVVGTFSIVVQKEKQAQGGTAKKAKK